MYIGATKTGQISREIHLSSKNKKNMFSISFKKLSVDAKIDDPLASLGRQMRTTSKFQMKRCVLLHIS